MTSHLTGDLVLEARRWPRGQIFMALAMASKVQALASTAAVTVFGITLKLKQDNKLVIVIIRNS